MAKPTVTIIYKVEGDDRSFRQLAKSADGLKAALKGTFEEGKKLNSGWINLAALTSALDQAQRSLQQLQSALNELTGAYQLQLEAETKLETVMRQRMGATDEEVQAIKNLCSAQQELGVIGDEVQLAGAQQLATFLKQKSTLAELIPAMNNLVAQQAGLNASQSDATSVANLMGKAMMGQTSSLRRVGITFDAAQESVLKYGNEQERAAMLAEVIKQNVGNMNAELAKTDAGKAKQMANTMGDLKEKVGGAVQGIAPYINVLASATIALAGVVKLAAGMKALYKWTIASTIAQKAWLAVVGQHGIISRMTEAVRGYTVAVNGATVATRVLGAAIKAIWIVAIITVAVVAITALVNKINESNAAMRTFASAQKIAADSAQEMADAHKAAAENMQSQIAALNIDIARLKDFTGTQAEEKKMVQDLNSRYGERMGYCKSVSEWYSILTANSRDYCSQLSLEAEIQNLAEKAAKHRLAARDIAYDQNGNKRLYSTEKKAKVVTGEESESSAWGSALAWALPGTARPGAALAEYDKLPSEKEAAQQSYDAHITAAKNFEKQMESLLRQSTSISLRQGRYKTDPYAMSSPTGSGQGTSAAAKNEPVYTPGATKLKDIEGNIQYYRKQLDEATVDTAAKINKEIAYWQKLADTINNAGKAVTNTTPKSPTLNLQANTLPEMEENLKFYQGKIDAATSDEEADIWREQYDAYEKKVNRRRNGPEAKSKDNKAVFDAGATTLKGIEDNIQALDDQLQTAGIAEAAMINRQIAAWQKKADAIRKAGTESRSAMDIFRKTWGAVSGGVSAVKSLTDAIDNNADAWTVISTGVDTFLQLFSSISSIIDIIKSITTATGAMVAVTTAQTAAKKAETAATVENTVSLAGETAAASGSAIAKATEAGAGLPFPANLGAIAAGVSAVLAALGIIGTLAFANGGIVPGNSPIGDHLIARVNSGEMILNAGQQRNLFNLLNGKASASGLHSIAATPVFPKIVGKVRGSDIILSVANTSHNGSHIGRRSGIII